MILSIISQLDCPIGESQAPDWHEMRPFDPSDVSDRDFLCFAAKFNGLKKKIHNNCVRPLSDMR